MSNDLKPFPDIEAVLRAALLERFGTAVTPEDQRIADVVTRLPGVVEDGLVYVERIGGTRGRLNDWPTVDIEVFAPTRAKAKWLIESIDAFLLGYPHSVKVGTETVILDLVYPTRTPVGLPWDDSVTRFGATYSLSVRR